MVDPNYSATAFLAADSDFSIEGIFDRLHTKYQRAGNAEVLKDGSDVQVNFGSWFLTISLSEDPPDPTGDLEILNHRKPVPADLDLATCSRRVKIHSLDPYPNLDHFNDFLQVCERVCDAFDGTCVRDNGSGTWF